MFSPTVPLILGSGSPRRREILDTLRIPYVVHKAEADESRVPGETPDAYLERVVLAKLAAVRATLPPSLAVAGRIVLVADTAVVFGHDILGKPGAATEAAAMVERLSGNTHEVRTRFALADAVQGDVLHGQTVVSRVRFRSMAPEEIRAYAASGEGLDKAGGYAVQGLGSAYVAHLEGSYTGVVGLPACELVEALRGLGLGLGR
jgi:septum formation protein